MKVLFLDIDGVVNKKENFNPTANDKFENNLWPIDSYCAFLVGRIQLQTGCEVVLSSSWRHHPDGVKSVSERVVKLLDKTGQVEWDGKKRNARGRYWPRELRGDEVNAWLDEHPEVTKYAILDDDSDFYDDQPLFKTTFDDGLTDEIATRVIAYLNDEPKFHSYSHTGSCMYCGKPEPDNADEDPYVIEEYKFKPEDICGGQ